MASFIPTDEHDQAEQVQPIDCELVDDVKPEAEQVQASEPKPTKATDADADLESVIIDAPFAEVHERDLIESALQVDRVAEAIESGISCDMFTDPRWQRFWEVAQELHNEGRKFDKLGVFEAQQDKGDSNEQLQATIDLNDAPQGSTGLGFKELCTRFKKQHSRREAQKLLKRASQMAEAGDFKYAAKLAERALQANERAEDSSGGLFQNLQENKFDPENLTEPQSPILTAKGRPIISRGNILTLVAPDKAGKSHVIAAMLQAITRGGRHLGIESKSRGRVAYLDFEQDREDFEHLLKHQGNADTENVAAYHLTGYTAKQGRESLRAIIQGEHELVAVCVDGFADLLEDVNDAETANALVAELMATAQKHNVAIIGVLHLNPGSDDKSRGHLGSQLGRKSQTVLQIKIKGDTRTLFTQRARKRPLPESEGIRFEWCNDSHGFVEIEGTPAEIKQAAKVEEWTHTLYEIQVETDSLAWKNKDLVEAIKQTEGVEKRTAQDRIQKWCKAGLLKHCANRAVYTSTLGGANDS